MMLEIRPARESDFDGIWPIFHAVVAGGDTYAYHPDTSRDEARAIWMSPAVTTYVALDRGRLVGTYILRPNQRGGGHHVANAGFMVAPDARSRGVGRAMGEHALREARRAGYLAMQFNFVISTNTGAVALWRDLGFGIVGTLPGAFRHPRLGRVDVYVMYRSLAPERGADSGQDPGLAGS